MTEAAPGIFIKSRIEIRGYLEIDEIIFKLDRIKSRVLRVWYLMRLIKVLTTKRTVYPWDIKHLNEILKAVGMLNAKANDQNGLTGTRKRISLMAADLGSKINKMQIEIINNMTFEECEEMSINLLINRYERLQDMMSAKHPTKKAYTSIGTAINGLRERLKSPQKHKQIEGPSESKFLSRKAFSSMVST